MPVLALPTIAGLTPPEHEVVCIDENIEDIDFDSLKQYDIVGLTGMTVQRDRMRDILLELHARDIFTVVGGPWITVAENWYDGLVDVIFIGEAEETWPQFLREWQQGLHQYRYEQIEKTDMAKVPIPRYELVKFKEYAMGCVQTSRGCPFQCEFCDIIVIFGRRPRIKTAEMVVAEIDAQHKLGVRVIFLVDDNFIGNKKTAKVILRAIIEWQHQNGFPLAFFTEASLDLAEDDELMRLMAEAGMVAVFIGIESPDEEALRETKKYQNVRQGGTLLEKVHRIQDAGMVVWCGMIMGFDSDDSGIFDRQIEFIQNSRISLSMSGMLYAIPKTPLYERLAAEGRLDLSDKSEFGTNVIPLQMSREELLDGYIRVLNELYDAQAYFARTDALFLRPDFEIGIINKRPWWRISLRWFWSEAQCVVESLGLFSRLITKIPETDLRREYYKRLWRFLKVHRRPGSVLFYVTHMVMHYHAWKMANQMSMQEAQLVNFAGNQ
jgi:radical SAM superfamily enzyme YgiQ (UPF0313 family)